MIIKPPHRIPTQLRATHRIVFLAGSIEMGRAENWQAFVETALAQCPNTIVLNPRRDDWDASWRQELDDLNFTTQVHWELEGIDAADVIFFHFDPSTTSPITLLELGLALRSQVNVAGCVTPKVVVSCPEGYFRRGNVLITCAKNGVHVHDAIETAIQEAKGYL